MSRVAGIPLHARWIAAALYVDGQSFSDIARQFGVTRHQARGAVEWLAQSLGMERRNSWGTRAYGVATRRTGDELRRRMVAVGLLS